MAVSTKGSADTTTLSEGGDTAVEDSTEEDVMLGQAQFSSPHWFCKVKARV